MILDETVKTKSDYNEGLKEAAYSVLGEIVNLLTAFADDIRIVGGWVPSLLYPNSDHIGSIDVDVLLNQENIERKKGYETIKEILVRNGYRKHESHYFTFVKTVNVDGIDYDVDVDLLSGKYGGIDGNISKHVDGIKALPSTGGNYAFCFPASEVEIEYRRPDGALDIGHVKVIAIVPFLIMKTAAMGRGKPKDAYDIYTCLKYFPGGVRALLEEFMPYKDKELVIEMSRKLREKFASPEHAGPIDIASFSIELGDEDREDIKQDAYQRVLYLTQGLE